MLTQSEYNVTKQKTKNISAKINLLNHNFQIVDQWENIVVGDPSFTIDSTSDIRRTCSISLIPIDKSFDVEYGNKIWLDKYVQIYLGIEDIRTKEIIYTNMGIYLIENPSRAYSATTNTISLQCVDLMAKMTGLRNGNLEGLDHIIKQNTNVRQAIIGTLELVGFTNYVVEECPFDVPNDIKISVGGTVYNILSELKNIAPNYQMYFDVDGVFHYEEIPNGKNEQIMVSDDIWKNTLISYQITHNFDDVKNCIEVFGKTHTIKNYADATITDDIYILNIAKVTEYIDNLKIGFTAPSKLDDPQVNISGLGVKAIRNTDGSIPILSDEANVYYVIKYLADKDYFLFMGKVTPYATVQDNNPNSPYYVNGSMGKVRIVLNGGDYDNIYMDTQALERAKWELYNRCKLQDSISLTCSPIYWLDVNWVIEITLPNKQGTGVSAQYIIKSINTNSGVSGTTTITAMRYYPYYDE